MLKWQINIDLGKEDDQPMEAIFLNGSDFRLIIEKALHYDEAEKAAVQPHHPLSL